MRRAAAALATILALTACGGDDSTAPDPDEAARGADAEVSGVGASCVATSTLEPEPAALIHEAAQTVFRLLRSGEHDTLWKALHPQARREDQREAYQASLASMQRRLQGGSQTATVAHGFFVDIQGGVAALTRVVCGEANDPERLTLITTAGDEDLAVVTLASGGDPFGFATTVQLRRSAKAWRVVGVHVGLDTYRGRNAADYERLADAYVKQNRIVEAYLVLALAEQLAARGSALKLDRELAIANKLEAVADSREFQQTLGVWEVGGRRYDIQGFAVTATQSDLSAVVRYVTPTGLIKEALEQEADALLGHLTMQHPEIAKRFDAVVFEAYDSEGAASEPGSEVKAFRTARVFPEPEEPQTPPGTPE